MISIFNNPSEMTSATALSRANQVLQSAMERLGTGKRINSAADDAAGLQIATRLQSQSNGMAVAQQNIGKASSLLQTADGAFDEMTNILYRMKDLAIQGADDSNGVSDRQALQSEFMALDDELKNILKNTTYGSDKLFSSARSVKQPENEAVPQVLKPEPQIVEQKPSEVKVPPPLAEPPPVNTTLSANQLSGSTISATIPWASRDIGLDASVESTPTPTPSLPSAESNPAQPPTTPPASYSEVIDTQGKLTSALRFQIGAGKDEVMELDLSEQINDVALSIGGLSRTGDELTTGASANNMIATISDVLNSVSSIRASLGASINRLGHTSNNLANMKDNSDNSIGVIRDTDYASESSRMTRQQMLAQSSQMMLRQAGSMSNMILSFLK